MYVSNWLHIPSFIKFWRIDSENRLIWNNLATLYNVITLYYSYLRYFRQDLWPKSMKKKHVFENKADKQYFIDAWTRRFVDKDH